MILVNVLSELPGFFLASRGPSKFDTFVATWHTSHVTHTEQSCKFILAPKILLKNALLMKKPRCSPRHCKSQCKVPATPPTRIPRKDPVKR